MFVGRLRGSVLALKDGPLRDGTMLFTANDIDRYSIGSTTDGLTENEDGALTIYLQHSPPHLPTARRPQNVLGQPIAAHPDMPITFE